MKTVVVAGRKGGVAKSTVARTLAVQALLEGRKSAILDVDQQATSLNWAKRREATAPAVRHIAASTIAAELTAFEQAGAEIVLIDTPPSTHPILATAIEAADACLIVTEAM